jgi:hypothetical protein
MSKGKHRPRAGIDMPKVEPWYGSARLDTRQQNSIPDAGQWAAVANSGAWGFNYATLLRFPAQSRVPIVLF